jgi:hypothetical protein
MHRFMDKIGSVAIALAFVIATLAGVDGGLKW